MKERLESETPTDWRELERRATQILQECGLEAERGREVETARGTVRVDVYAVDPSTTPPITTIVECKQWQTRVPKAVVHSFRTVIEDLGASVGILLSSAGFQSGAIEAASYTSIRLLDWRGFEEIFVERWKQEFMFPNLARHIDPLLEYMEPINSRIFLNSRIFRKADQLPEQAREQFKLLRKKYFELSTFLRPIAVDAILLPPWSPSCKFEVPPSPIRTSLVESAAAGSAAARQALEALPANVLDANALRSLYEALLTTTEAAIAAFDYVFGGRA